MTAKKRNWYDAVAELYDEAFPSIGLRLREFDWFVAQARPAASEVLVEIGCGNGRFLEAAAPFVKKAIGLDPSTGMIRLARRNLADLKNVTVKQAAGEKTGLPAACADIVVSFFSFRYLDWERGLREMRRILKPGGRLVVIDMFRNRTPVRRFFPALVAKARTLMLIRSRRGASRALRRLTRDPTWQAMLRACPPRDLVDFERTIRERFPLARFTVLDRGFRATTVAWHSQPSDLFRIGPRRGAPALAVLDWGIGGLGFYSLFKKKNPRLPVLYFSDSGFIPYGKVSAGGLRRRLSAIIGFLKLNGVRHLVVACNAMSAALDGFAPGPGLKITGVIRPALAILSGSGEKAIGLIGGKGTIRSGAYQRELRAAGIAVNARATQRLSAFIEAGDIVSPAFTTYLTRVLRPVRDAPLLVLACTHYPAAEKPIRALLKGRLLDPARLALDWVEKNWKLPSAAGGRDVFLTTGDPERTVVAAQRMFGVAIRGLRKIGL